MTSQKDRLPEDVTTVTAQDWKQIEQALGGRHLNEVQREKLQPRLVELKRLSQLSISELGKLRPRDLPGILSSVSFHARSLRDDLNLQSLILPLQTSYPARPFELDQDVQVTSVLLR